MDSSSSKKIPQNLIEVSDNERLLKSIIIYGANSSGKSNLIKAVFFMWNMIVHSHNFNVNTKIPVTPFKLDETSRKNPSNFEIKFIHKDRKYRYGFSCDSSKIIEEYLFDISTNKQKSVFERKKTKDFYFKTDEKQQELIKQQTIENTLYLSRATQLGYDKTRDVYEFFTKNLVININPEWQNHTIKSIHENSSFKGKIIEILKKADFGGIENIIVKREKVPCKQFRFNIFGDNSFEARDVVDDKYDVKVMHRTKNGRIVYFDLNEESSGTIKTLMILGPLLDIMENGKIAFIDELELNLHPEITRLLVRLFNSNKNKNAQLILTTHDTTLLDNELFRRDQVYLCSKEPNSYTELSSLLDYDIRQETDFERAYLNGRFGGVPIIDETLFY